MTSKHSPKVAGKKILLTSIVIFLVLSLLFFNLTSYGKEFWRKISVQIGLVDLPYIADDYEINFHFLSTGKSDCIIIENKDTYILVDGGTANTVDFVSTYMKKCGIDSLDAVVASHPDNDHIGGLPWILDGFPTNMLYTSNYSGFESQDIDELYSTADRSGVEVIQLNSGNELFFGDLVLTVIGPLDLFDSTNDRSLVIKCTYKDFSVLLTGDMADHELKTIMSVEADISADILKAPHHGSSTGINKEFLERVSPVCAVITVGKNKSSLPSEKTLSLLMESDVEILDTENSGNILISSNGGSDFYINQSNKIYY